MLRRTHVAMCIWCGCASERGSISFPSPVSGSTGIETLSVGFRSTAAHAICRMAYTICRRSVRRGRCGCRGCSAWCGRRSTCGAARCGSCCSAGDFCAADIGSSVCFRAHAVTIGSTWANWCMSVSGKTLGSILTLVIRKSSASVVVRTVGLIGTRN